MQLSELLCRPSGNILHLPQFPQKLKPAASVKQMLTSFWNCLPCGKLKNKEPFCILHMFLLPPGLWQHQWLWTQFLMHCGEKEGTFEEVHLQFPHSVRITKHVYIGYSKKRQITIQQKFDTSKCEQYEGKEGNLYSPLTNFFVSGVFLLGISNTHNSSCKPIINHTLKAQGRN